MTRGVPLKLNTRILLRRDVYSSQTRDLLNKAVSVI